MNAKNFRPSALSFRRHFSRDCQGLVFYFRPKVWYTIVISEPLTTWRLLGRFGLLQRYGLER